MTPEQLIPSLILAVLLIETAIPLFTGGFALLKDNPNYVIEVCGVIEDVEQLSSFGGAKYNVDYNSAFGVHITIDGVEYTSASSGGYDVGDEVVIGYLPNSHFVMYIGDGPENMIGETSDH